MIISRLFLRHTFCTKYRAKKKKTASQPANQIKRTIFMLMNNFIESIPETNQLHNNRNQSLCARNHK